MGDLVGAGLSLLSGASSGKGASKAASIQADAYKQGIAQQAAQFAQTQQNLSPFIQAGSGALGAYGNLLGTNGSGAQSSAISALQNSPLFQSQYGTGVDTVLQNAAATGGVRGGNVNNSLAQFGSGLLSNVIQNQLGNLSGLINTGAGAASGLGSLGQSNSNSLSSLLQGQGNAQATGAASPYAAFGNTLQGLASSGALTGLFGGNKGAGQTGYSPTAGNFYSGLGYNSGALGSLF